MLRALFERMNEFLTDEVTCIVALTHFTLHCYRIDAWAIRRPCFTFVNALANSILGCFYSYPLYTVLLSDSRWIGNPTQARPWVSHQAASARIFSTIRDSAKDYYIVELFNLCAKYVVLQVDDFSIGNTLNFVSQLCGYDSSVHNGTHGVA